LPEDQAQAMVERRFGLLFGLAPNSRHGEDTA